MTYVLLLNASYEPLHVCSWKRAIVLLLKGKAVTVESAEQNGHSLPLLQGTGKSSTQLGFSHKPSVIRLNYYIKIPHTEIPLNRKNIFYRDNFSCQYCDKKVDLTIDHVLPRSRGGKDTWDNMVTACLRCNVLKGSKTPGEANMLLKKQPVKPGNFVHFELSKRHYSGQKQYATWKKYLHYLEKLDS